MRENTAQRLHVEDPLPQAELCAAEEPASKPLIGEIYRDRSNRSLIVLAFDGDAALVEYADGTLSRIDASAWRRLEPRPHVF